MGEGIGSATTLGVTERTEFRVVEEIEEYREFWSEEDRG